MKSARGTPASSAARPWDSRPRRNHSMAAAKRTSFSTCSGEELRSENIFSGKSRVRVAIGPPSVQGDQAPSSGRSIAREHLFDLGRQCWEIVFENTPDHWVRDCGIAVDEAIT